MGTGRMTTRAVGSALPLTRSSHLRLIRRTPPDTKMRWFAPDDGCGPADLEQPMTLTPSRRSVLHGGVAASALVVATPSNALAAPLGPSTEFATSRASRLSRGTRLVHADLHNHSLQSDAAGEPEEAYVSMRDAGLDVAALTDHSVAAFAVPGDACALFPAPAPGGTNACRSLLGLDEAGWQNTRALADASDADGDFTAVAGFEWSSPALGHMNVWFSSRWIDPLLTDGITPLQLASIGLSVPALQGALAQLGVSPGQIAAIVSALLVSQDRGMRSLYDWLLADPQAQGIGGGADGIAGFNHPNREPLAFANFEYDDRVRERIVSMEIMNREEDYLFKEFDNGFPSPLTSCLNAGWDVGLLGVTDEHGTNWGEPDGKGRAGLYVGELTRAGVREAMEARRFFATNLRGLRLDATANGVQMGGRLERVRRGSAVRFVVDLDRGPEFAGTPVQIQVLRPGTDVPEVVHVEDVAMSSGQLIRFGVRLDPADGDWVVLRVADPTRPNNQPGPAGHPCNNLALAYTSPWRFGTGRDITPTRRSSAGDRVMTNGSGWPHQHDH